MNNYIASRTSLGPPIEGLGILGFEGGSGADAPSVFNKIISSAIGLMTVIAIIWFLIVFLTGAIGIIGSGGEKGAYETARKKMMTGVIGLVVVVATVALVDLIGWILGINLILNPGDLLVNIGIR